MFSVVHLISGGWGSITDAGRDETNQNERERKSLLYPIMVERFRGEYTSPHMSNGFERVFMDPSIDW